MLALVSCLQHFALGIAALGLLALVEMYNGLVALDAWKHL
jgi:hypothetical protein